MPELSSKICFWPGITRHTRKPSCFVSMPVLLFIGNLFAFSLSHCGLNTSLVCSAGVFQCRDGFCPSVQHPGKVCPLGFSCLQWNRDEGSILVFLSSWMSHRSAYRLKRCWCFCSLKQKLLLRPQSPLAVHTSDFTAGLQLNTGEKQKAAGPSCAVSKAASEPGSILPSPNSCKYSCRWIAQAASVWLVLRNLS